MAGITHSAPAVVFSADHDDFLTGFGCGLTLILGKALFGRPGVGMPLSHIGPETDDFRIRFYLQSTPFQNRTFPDTMRPLVRGGSPERVPAVVGGCGSRISIRRSAD